MSTHAEHGTNYQNSRVQGTLDTSSLAQEQPLLEIYELSTGYGETQVLWDISLHVMPGEVVALVGANGAGKSTLLSTISGLLQSWQGTIVFAGRDITCYRAERIAKLGLIQVQQGRRLFGGLTIEENLRLGAYTNRAGSARAIAADLERVYTLLPKLYERRKQVTHSLSGGEQQMCAIARGLMARPALLMIDELSLGLAPNIVDDLLAAIDNIHRHEQISFLLIEQDVQIALERAQRGYIIESGHLVLSGPATDLLKSERVRIAYLGE
jgi:branched-chain amino acid transport system ATP-binding protein